MDAFTSLVMFFGGLIIFIAILLIDHWTHKSYKELVQLNRNIVVMIEEIRDQKHTESEKPAQDDSGRPGKPTPVPRIKT
jgi:hypothetical protein